MKLIFWISAFIIFYHFIGYGLLITILSKLKRRREPLPLLSDDDLPELTLLVAAYNEEQVIEAKIKNSLALNYPQEKLKICFVTDGSTDRTNQMVESFPEVSLFHQPQRQGKIAAVNRVMPKIKTPITIFSDANVMINKDGIRSLVNHFQSNLVGAVSGEKRIVSLDEDNASGSGEGFYWRYESYLKQKDADWNTLVGSAGELFAMRTHLYEPIKQNTLIEDFIMTMQLAAEGYRVAYEPEAQAVETASESITEEKKRKVRISAGGIQAVIRLMPLLNVFRFGKLTFQYVSHRALRWTLVPLCLLATLSISPLLASESLIYDVLFRVQAVFYLLALGGYAIRDARTNNKYLHIPYYFAFMHWCVVLGWVKYLKGEQSVAWDKARRAELVNT